MPLKLSKASKMPCLSWSLQAIDTCPGSIGPDGDLVPACKGCYATTGNYRFPNVKKPRLLNRDDWRRLDWVADVVASLERESFFRWFDSGDVYALPLARKILQVMEQTPHVKHWLPTRMYKFPKFHAVFAAMESLPNVVVRYSSDSISGETVPGRNTSTIVGDTSQVPNNATICPAYTRAGKCLDCRHCWDQSVAVIAYPAHGVSMLKLIREAS
jgi:hypothetical protein